jgi:hypothetical protein
LAVTAGERRADGELATSDEQEEYRPSRKHGSIAQIQAKARNGKRRRTDRIGPAVTVLFESWAKGAKREMEQKES